MILTKYFLKYWDDINKSEKDRGQYPAILAKQVWSMKVS